MLIGVRSWTISNPCGFVTAWYPQPGARARSCAWIGREVRDAVSASRAVRFHGSNPHRSIADDNRRDERVADTVGGFQWQCLAELFAHFGPESAH